MNDTIGDPHRPYIGLSVRRAFRSGERCELFPQSESSEYVLWIESESGKRSTRIQDAEVTRVVAALRTLNLPLVNRFTGFDTNTYTLTFGHHDRVHVSWFGWLPPEWNSLIPALIQINKLSGIDVGIPLTTETA